jgi:hypothetical protein
VDFDITITNPCIAATINDITFSSASLTVADGTTGTVTFSIPTDSVDSSNTIKDLCGTKTYTVKDSSANVITTWATISADASTNRQYILTIDSN